MKNIILGLILFFSISCLSQECLDTIPKKEINYKNKPWSLSLTTGYLTGTINRQNLDLGNNIWGSINLGYSTKKFNVTLWSGSNYWTNESRLDFRFGLSTTYTFLKW